MSYIGCWPTAVLKWLSIYNEASTKPASSFFFFYAATETWAVTLFAPDVARQTANIDLGTSSLVRMASVQFDVTSPPNRVSRTDSQKQYKEQQYQARRCHSPAIRVYQTTYSSVGSGPLSTRIGLGLEVRG